MKKKRRSSIANIEIRKKFAHEYQGRLREFYTDKKEAKKMAELARRHLNYSPNTADCDILWGLYKLSRSASI